VGREIDAFRRDIKVGHWEDEGDHRDLLFACELPHTPIVTRAFAVITSAIGRFECELPAGSGHLYFSPPVTGTLQTSTPPRLERKQHARLGSVYAFKSELDAWRETRKGVTEFTGPTGCQ
jgi:hypothetical protein